MAAPNEGDSLILGVKGARRLSKQPWATSVAQPEAFAHKQPEVQTLLLRKLKLKPSVIITNLTFICVPDKGNTLATLRSQSMSIQCRYCGSFTASGVLKDYLRELPSPLISKPLYEAVLEAMAKRPLLIGAGGCENEPADSEHTVSLLETLPEIEKASV
ncbi:hypothetical protein NFI96_007934 [Prochilodus magdalenae]|nr:hypothetical protein NFI96_007934 [Prochilodus magdalenae]